MKQHIKDQVESQSQSKEKSANGATNLKENSSQKSRRSFLQSSLGTGLSISVLSASLFKPFKALGAFCGLTPPQSEGPFYPGQNLFTHDNDLTQIPGHPLSAKGQVVFIIGKVLDSSCKPISNANVEIWQACVSGKYQHLNDPNPAPADPNFRYWGETFTDNQGRYWFKTIIPGDYPAGEGWTRPPHIHYKINALGFHELTTQMYFKGHPLNDKDLILNRVPQAQRSAVVIEFKPERSDLPKPLPIGSLIGEFNISLKSVRRS